MADAAHKLYRQILEDIEINRGLVKYIQYRLSKPLPLCDQSVLQVDLDEAIGQIRKGRKEALRVKCQIFRLENSAYYSSERFQNNPD
jgi:hypothetical protein